MLDFKTEFFPLLNKILYKEINDVSEHIITNSDMYLLNRYITFYHHNLAELVNKTTNKLNSNLTSINDAEYLYELINSVIPKLPKGYIKYIAKPKVAKNNIDTFIKDYSIKNNVSEREVWGMYFLLEEINKNASKDH